MKKEVLLGALLVSAPLASAKELLEIKITSGIRSEQSRIDTPVTLDVITREEIDASGAAHLVDVLRGRGSIQVIDTFGNGARASISMRGFGDTANANTLVLVDGRRLNNPDIGSPDLSSISIKDIERIEIIQGSASVLYGDQAVGGVINVITRKSTEPVAYVEYGVGSYNGQRLVANVSRKLTDDLSIRLAGEKRDSDGYRDHSESLYDNYSAGLQYDFNQGFWFADMQSTHEDIHTPGALFFSDIAVSGRRHSRPEYRNDYIDTQTDVFRTGVNTRINDNWSFEGEWTYRESDGEFIQSFRGGAAGTRPTFQDRRINSFNPRLIGQHVFKGREVVSTLGVDVETSRYRFANAFGFQKGDQAISSAYGQWVVGLNERFKLSYGIRSSRVENEFHDGGAFGSTFATPTDINNDVTASELGLQYRPNSQWRLYWRLAENYRFAKLDEYIDGVNTASIIDDQTGHALEFGVDYEGDAWSTSFQAYSLKLNNEIAFNPNTFDNINLDATKRQGVVVNAAYRFNARTRAELDLNVLDAEVVSGTFAGNEIPLVANYTARVGIRHAFNDQWNAGAELYAVGDRVYSGDFDRDLDQLNGYRVVNLTAQYEHKNWSATFRIGNVLNEKYAEFGAKSGTNESIQPSPERNFQASIRYRFQ